MPGTLTIGIAKVAGWRTVEFIIFVFDILFLSNYRLEYYEYVVKWWSGVACNWCTSLAIALLLALQAFGRKVQLIPA